MAPPLDHGRRAFLRIGARPGARRAVIRPPWTSAESLERCTHCGDCVAACPEGILVPDGKGVPTVDFSIGGCTFCGACADVCTAAVFQRDVAPPWLVSVAISDRCLPRRGIVCESCRDACGDGAIRFVRAPGRAPVPEIALECCTGCGACISVCPESAISVLGMDEGAAHG